MSTAELIYNLPYIGSVILSAAVFFYARRHRKAQGATVYTLFAFGQTLWIFGKIFEIVSSDLASKLHWFGIQWLAEIVLLIAFPVFVIQYTGHQFKNPGRIFRLSLIVPGGFFLLLISNPFHLAPQRDWIPFTSAIGLLIVAWGLLRFRVFEIVPLAREKVFDNMIDPANVDIDDNPITSEKVWRALKQR